MPDICPECRGDAWANEGDGFYCVGCGWPDREWYLYPEDEDEWYLYPEDEDDDEYPEDEDDDG